MLTAPDIPETMRAAQAKDYGDIDEMLAVEENVKVPRLSDLPEAKRKDFMIIRTLAVSLAPGDCRILSGKTREIQGPPSFPYIPSGDCCGIIVELPDGSEDLPFKLGDRVAARFVEGPRNALAEYARVTTKVVDKVPDDISSVDAAALAGASCATVLSQRIEKGEKVLVLGARGGVGSHLTQLLRDRGASYVVGVSRNPASLLEGPFACDVAIDYTKEDVYTKESFQQDKFDVIVDLAGFGFSRLEECAAQRMPSIVKPASEGGRFLTLVSPIGPTFEAHSLWQAMQIFLFASLGKAISSRTWRRRKLPAYTFAMSLPGDRECITLTFEKVETGKLKAVVDTKSPFQFNTEGVRAGFRLQESRHSHGKVVIKVAEK